MKYVDTLVSFQEVPDEISLCINISNCPNSCIGCHSPWLKQDIGTVLDSTELYRLVNANKGITCVSFMGGDSEPEIVNFLASEVKKLNLKTAWYSGFPEISDKIELRNFDFIKIGPYLESLGGLDNLYTNQTMYEVCRISKLPEKFILKDITNKFWKNDRTEKESTC